MAEVEARRVTPRPESHDASNCDTIGRSRSRLNRLQPRLTSQNVPSALQCNAVHSKAWTTPML